MRHLIRTGISWIPLGIAITLICGLIYVTVQQNYRQSLDDPQIQMAEDAAAEIEQGSSPASVVPKQEVNMAASLAPWLAVYTASGTPIASSATLNGAEPIMPQGVFDISTWHKYAADLFPVTVPSNEDRFTWQPQSNVRQAVVLVQASNGMFVASGRNMREVENREGTLTLMVGLGWIVTLVISFVAQVVVQYLA